MDEILIEPDAFQGEIDSLSSAKEAISDEILNIDTEGLELETINQLQQIVNKLNDVVKAYKASIAQDVKNLETIKLEWMAVDGNIAVHMQGPTYKETEYHQNIAPGPVGKGHLIS